MGIFKKNKTFTDADAQNLFDKNDYEEGRKNARRVAIKQYIEDVGGRYVWEHDIDLVDYIGNDDSVFANGWDKALKLSQSAKYAAELHRKNRLDPTSYQGDYYPMIMIKGYDVLGRVEVRNAGGFKKEYIHTEGNTALREANKAMCKELNLDWGDLVKQFQDAYGGEWGNIHSCFLGLGVEIPDANTIEKVSRGESKANVAYAFHFFKHLMLVRKGLKPVSNTPPTNSGTPAPTPPTPPPTAGTGVVHNPNPVPVDDNPAIVRIRQGGLRCEVADDKYLTQINELYNVTEYAEYAKLKGYEGWDIRRGDYWLEHEKRLNRYRTPRQRCWKEEVGGDRSFRIEERCETVYYAVVDYKYYLHFNHIDSDGKHHKISIISSHLYDGGSDSIVNIAPDNTPSITTKHERERKDYTETYYTTTYPLDSVNAWVMPRHGFAFNGDTVSDLMVLPVDKKLLDNFSVKDKAKLIRENFYVFHVWQKTVKVYRSWVKPFIQIGSFIIAVVITVKSAGTGAKLGAALMKAATALAVTVGIDKLIDFAVKIGLISARTAAVIKVVVAIVMVAHGAGWDFSKILTAPNIMKVVNASFDQYNKMKALEVEQLNQQMNEHNTMHAKRVHDLKEKQKLHMDGFSQDASIYLKTPSFIPRVDLFETPEMMYARHRNYNVVSVSQGLISHLSEGLYTGRPKLYEIHDSSEDLQDMLIIS